MNQLQNQINSLFCKDHPENNLIFINTANDNQLAYKCDQCSIDLQSTKDFLSLTTIRQCDDNYIFLNWPPLKDYSILTEIKQLKVQEMNDIIKRIETVFDQMRDEIIQKIDQKKKEAIQIAQVNQINKQDLIDKYNEIAGKQQLKQFTQVHSQNIEQLSEQIKEFVQKQQNERENNTNQLQNLLEKYKNSQNFLQLSDHNILKNNILTLLDHFQIVPNLVNSNSIQQKCQQIKQVINQLVNNKFNHLNPTFLKSFNQIYESINPIFKDLDIENIFEKQPINLDELTEKDFCELEQISQSILSNNKQKEKGEQILSNQGKFLLNLLSNSSNFLSKQFIGDITNVLSKIEPIIKTLNISIEYTQIQNKQPIEFKDFLLQQLDQINDLTKKISELNNLQDKQLNNQNRKNSYFVFNKMKDHIKDSNQFQKLLIDLPIFELLNFQIYNNNLNPGIFGKAKTSLYNSSNQIKIIENIQDDYIQIQKNSHLYGGMYFDYELNKQKKYVARFRFDQSIGDYLIIGLVNKNNAIQEQLSSTQKGKIFGLSNQGYCGKVIKGSLFNEVNNGQIIELRIDISQKIIQCSDYPEYKNTNQLNDNYLLDPEVVYFLGMQFGTNSDYRLNVDLIYFQEQDQF